MTLAGRGRSCASGLARPSVAVLPLVQPGPLRSRRSNPGYALATLPPWLEAIRQQGLFSVSHVPMNLDYLFWHLPSRSPQSFPFFRPDGLGMSILLTSPGVVAGRVGALASRELGPGALALARRRSRS